MRRILFLLGFVSLSAQAQLALNGGMSSLINVGRGNMKYGFNAGFEFFNDESSSIYGRVTGTFRQNVETPTSVFAIDATTSPQVLSVTSRTGVGFLNIEGGKRMYFIGSNDYGFGMYGGSFIGLTTMGVKEKITGDYDQTKYYYGSSPNQLYDTKGRLYLLNLGLNVGVKYQVSMMSLFFDISGYYNTNFGVTSSNLVNNYISQHVSPIMFSFNFGVRKDLFY